MPGVTSTNGDSAEMSTAARKYLAAVKPKLIIGGEFVDAIGGGTFPVLDPRTEEEIFRVPDAQAGDIDLAVAAAKKAFEEGPWPKMSASNRGRIMLKIADIIEEHIDELAHLESLDNGKPLAVAKAADISLSAGHFRYYAGLADKIQGATIQLGDWFDMNAHCYTLKEPKGVVGCITPWNFPLLMMSWKIAPALAAGCTVVIKVAEQTPLTALRVGELALEAGLPPGVLNVITGFGPTAGAPLVTHPDVSKISFTGSTEVGQIISRACSDLIRPVTLELGGKSAMIILKDADVEKAAQIAHEGLFFNHGQCCAASSRVFCHASIYDAFVARCAELAQNRKVGDPFHPETQQGPQVDEDQFNKIMGYIDAGRASGAKMLCGGKRWGERGYFIEPTVFADVDRNASIAREEIFGPVQSILKYETEEEAIAFANDSPYGLASGIVGNDINAINRISRALKAGTVWVGTWNCYAHSLPFGGYKMSGLGRDKGVGAIENFLNTKTVVQAVEGGLSWN